MDPAIRLLGLVGNTNYEICGRSLDPHGHSSAWSAPFLTCTRPPVPFPLVAVPLPLQGGGMLIWDYSELIANVGNANPLLVDLGIVSGNQILTVAQELAVSSSIRPTMFSPTGEFVCRLSGPNAAAPGGTNDSGWSGATQGAFFTFPMILLPSERRRAEKTVSRLRSYHGKRRGF